MLGLSHLKERERSSMLPRSFCSHGWQGGMGDSHMRHTIMGLRSKDKRSTGSLLMMTPWRGTNFKHFGFLLLD